MTSDQRWELWSRSELTQYQGDRLTQLLAQVIPANPFWTKKYAAAGIDPESIRGLDDLHLLPLTAKSELVADQLSAAPYGTNLTFPVGDYCRLHQTSGTTTGQPMRWMDTSASWNWVLECWSTIYRLLGLRRDDRLCFPFSFGPFLGFWAAFEGASRQGNLCLAAGGMSSEARLKLILENQVTWIGCTPTYALRLAEVAAAQGIDVSQSSVRAVLVAGEPGGSIPSVRARIAQAWGARVFDHWGMTEIGPLATECEDDTDCLTVNESACIPEIIDPETGNPSTTGKGELVITNLGRIGSPLIRYRTGDLVEVAQDPHPSGRVWMRLKGGIQGRTDDMLIIRGNNVFPSSIEEIVREFPAVAEFRIVVTRHREMQHIRLELEPTPSANPETLVESISATIKQKLQFHAEVKLVPFESLPRFEMKARRLVRES
ncbi:MULTISPECIES: phenylacetate--CoA ligase family protein [unclassified Schlesneria]|uniref:phenylacetate--CoA ligase family protein n=1 Tax=unclassified Schlesneria TaxID=2762017 RepID=UPI002EDC8A4D